MSKFEEACQKAMNQLDELGISYDKDLLSNVAKGLGPALYNTDASLVSFTDKTEMETVRKNFITNKLGCTDEEMINKAIERVQEKMKGRKRNLRMNVYYLLTKELNKEDIYNS